MAVGFMLLKATELGLVLHPIAGYNPIAVKEAFNITESYEVITLLIAGEKDENIKPYFKDYQIEAENKRPARRDVKDFVFINTF
jgi:nitroreductase